MPHQRQSWSDVVINRPNNTVVGSQLQSALKTAQAIHVPDDTHAPPRIRFAKIIDDADSEDDEDSSNGNSNSDSNSEDKDTNDGSGDATSPPDLWRRYQRRLADQRQWETRFSSNRSTYTEPTTGTRYEPRTEGKVFFQMEDVIKDTFLANES